MNNHKNGGSWSRRAFAGLATGCAVLPKILAQESSPSSPTPQRPGTVREVPPFEGALKFERKTVSINVQPFPMKQVRLTGGVWSAAQEWNRGYIKRLPADRLLHNFRVNAGLPSEATAFGGWEAPDCELRGHFTGHYLSASALMYAATDDSELKAKGDYMVGELAKCQRKLGGGYLSAFPREFWNRLDARQKVWAPFYTIHKIMAGMLDQYQLTGNQQALQVLKGMATWADDWTASKSEAHMQQILETEYGGMNEVLYNLSATTGDDRWARVGDRFTKNRFFNPLVLRRDELRGLHANTHIPQVIGAARRYELSNDMRFHDVADYFWSEIANARSYVTGGTSNDEGWLTPPRQLAEELKLGIATAECCCSYNMLKLTRHLYSWTGDPRYFDYYERTMLNHRLGTIHPDTGHTQYYFSLTPGAYRSFNDEDKSFWCCTGSGLEEYSKLNDSIYWHDNDGLYVNLFVASQLEWPEKQLRIRQETSFPEQPGTLLHISVERPVRMALRIRIPSWVVSGGSVALNGQALDSFAGPGSYLTLDRTWHTGDRVQLTLPMKLHTQPMPDAPEIQALLYGPLVLAADLGADGIKPDMVEGSSAPELWKLGSVNVPGVEFVAAKTIPAGADNEERHIPAQILPRLTQVGADPNEWIKPASAPLTFQTTGQTQNLTFEPANSLFERRYSIYFAVS